jgi:hypothetical protein
MDCGKKEINTKTFFCASTSIIRQNVGFRFSVKNYNIMDEKSIEDKLNENFDQVQKTLVDKLFEG